MQRKQSRRSLPAGHSPQPVPAPLVWLGVIAYSLQLYFDFFSSP